MFTANYCFSVIIFIFNKNLHYDYVVIVHIFIENKNMTRNTVRRKISARCTTV